MVSGGGQPPLTQPLAAPPRLPSACCPLPAPSLLAGWPSRRPHFRTTDLLLQGLSLGGLLACTLHGWRFTVRQEWEEMVWGAGGRLPHEPSAFFSCMEAPPCRSLPLPLARLVFRCSRIEQHGVTAALPALAALPAGRCRSPAPAARRQRPGLWGGLPTLYSGTGCSWLPEQGCPHSGCCCWWPSTAAPCRRP